MLVEFNQIILENLSTSEVSKPFDAKGLFSSSENFNVIERDAGIISLNVRHNLTIFTWLTGR